MKKRSVNIHGHQTSITLEDAFWDALKNEARAQGLSLNAMIAQIDDGREHERGSHNLSSAIRLYILRRLQDRLNAATP